jgi:hypothetical protein
MRIIVTFSRRLRRHSRRPLRSNPQTSRACARQRVFVSDQGGRRGRTGEAVTGPRDTVTPNGPSACEYTGSGIHKVQLTVYPLTAASAAVYRGLCAKKNKDGLTGLGDATCWYNEKHEELQVLKGSTVLMIEVQRSGDPTEAIKGVARKVYDRVK